MSHCPICDVCVEGMDHHCPVMGVCVADKTFKTFSLFIFYGGMQCTLIGVGHIVLMKLEKDPKDNDQFSNMQSFMIAGFMLVYGVSLSIGAILNLSLGIFPHVYDDEKLNHDPNYDRA